MKKHVEHKHPTEFSKGQTLTDFLADGAAYVVHHQGWAGLIAQVPAINSVLTDLAIRYGSEVKMGEEIN